MFGSKPDALGRRQVQVLFDHSLSMEYREGSLTGRKRGAMELEKIINTLGADDVLNVRVVGRDATACFPESSTDHTEALSFVRALEPGYGRADFNKANAAALQELSTGTGRPEIYYISDFQRTTWAEVELAKMPDRARLFFVNVAPKERANHAILSAAMEPGNASALGVQIGNFSAEPWCG